MSKGIILMYHRVCEASIDPWSLSVSPLHFSQHLEMLKKWIQPIRLQQLTDVLEFGKLPERWAVITLDDGYLDNLLQASPILKFHGVPATFFLVSACLGSITGYWWDELEFMLLHPGKLPSCFDLEVCEKEYHIELEGAVSYSENDFRRDRGWQAWGSDNPTPRHALYRLLHGLLRSQTEKQRKTTMHDLYTWSGFLPGLASDRSLVSVEEATVLAQQELFEIGVHTATHSDLACLPLVQQQEEIVNSKVFFERLLGSPIAYFSYPYGSYTAESISIVRNAGFSCACSATQRPIQDARDCFQLPRLHVQNCDGAEFQRRLVHWLSQG